MKGQLLVKTSATAVQPAQNLGTPLRPERFVGAAKRISIRALSPKLLPLTIETVVRFRSIPLLPGDLRSV
jgi:hypothetical protein